MFFLRKKPSTSSQNKGLKRAFLKSRSGQVTVEYILLGAVLAFLFKLVTTSNPLKDSLQNFQETPYKVFNNLLETGNLISDGPTGPTATEQHPNNHKLHYTSDGE